MHPVANTFLKAAINTKKNHVYGYFYSVFLVDFEQVCFRGILQILENGLHFLMDFLRRQTFFW